MLEYVFFHETAFQLFVKDLEIKKISPKITIEEDSYEIAIPEDIDDDLLNELDEKYDELMEWNQKLFEEQQGIDTNNYNLARIVFKLKDGTTSHADIDSTLMTRIMKVITPEELNKIIDVIVTAVENPEERTICQRIREGEVL